MRSVRLPRLAAVLGLAVLVANASPSIAQEEEPKPCHEFVETTDEDGNTVIEEQLVFEELPQWIKAPEQRIGNLGATDAGSYPTWSGDEPTQSVEEGAGGISFQSRAGNPVNGFQHRGETAGHFVGTFTGCINTIAADIYVLSPLAPASGNVVTRFVLKIDGVDVHATATDPGPDINAPSEGDTGMLYRLRFAFTGIYNAMSSFPADFAPLEGEHTIELNMFSQYVDDAQGGYVYDTTEAPSALTFNMENLTAHYTKIEPTY